MVKSSCMTRLFYNKKNEEKERIGSNHEKYKKAAGCSAGRAAVRICDGLCKQQLFKHGGRNAGDVFHGERGRDRGEYRQGPCGYDDDIQGLCKYLEDCKAAAGEKVQMSYDVIGAENGYKYVYRYADSAVQLEVYEFPAELSETAKALLDAVRADGTFKVLDNTVPGYLSNDGRFLLIYTDAKSEKEDANKTHKEHVLECFNTFADAKAK